MNSFMTGLDGLFMLNPMRSRAICAENPTGEVNGSCKAVPGPENPARELGVTWKVRPSIRIPAGETAVIADYTGESGLIQHIWMTPTENYRDQILRFWFDDMDTPAIEVPVGDFFADGWQTYSQISSLAVCRNPKSGFNCYWPMPFHRAFRITMENRGKKDSALYYQIDYALCEIPENAGYFRATFRRSNPTVDGIHTILSGVTGKGRYVGTYLAWQVNNNGWWGEGEVKFFLDGEKDYPTICTTGTEDYFGGSYNFDIGGQYAPFSTPYTGMQMLKMDELYVSQKRFGLYRWHLQDPVCFDNGIEVNIQDLGWRCDWRFRIQQSDIASVAYWYEQAPLSPLAPLPSRDDMEII